MSQASFTLRTRNPDVLTCIANLSNDEVFTPPEFANQMLDKLADAWAPLSGNWLPRKARSWFKPTASRRRPSPRRCWTRTSGV